MAQPSFYRVVSVAKIEDRAMTHCAVLQGVSSKDFVHELGYLGSEEIVHRDNICLLSQRRANFSEPDLSARSETDPTGERVCSSSIPLDTQIQQAVKSNRHSMKARCQQSPTGALRALL
jgi:hypothetical protein